MIPFFEKSAMAYQQQFRLIIWVILLAAVGCTSPATPDTFKLDIGKSNPDRLLQFYFGSYVSAEGGDPFATGLLTKEGGAYILNVAQLSEQFRGFLQDTNQDGTLVWDELEPFLQDTYYEAQLAPATLDAVKNQLPDFADTTKIMRVEIDGVMTTARRRIIVERSAVEDALLGLEKNDGQILYPQGTIFWGEHWDGDKIVETTVMKKRGDNFWDFYVYDHTGALAKSTSTKPRELAVPTRCVGCHFGGKRFEPDASYPHPASAGPSGPRAIHVAARPADTLLVALFDEHEKRSDTILGIYATLYSSQLMSSREQGGELSAKDKQILDMISGAAQ